LRNRRKPISHIVHSHVRNRKRVHSYPRGNGTAEAKPEPKIIKELPKPRTITNDGWKGSKYERTRNLPLKEVAKLIKSEIQIKYPFIKVSVSTKHFSGGREVNVHITSYPKTFLVKKVIYPEYENQPEDKIPSFAWSYPYDEDAQNVVDGIRKIVDSYNYDNSDSQIDYFDKSFYSDVTFDWGLAKKEQIRLGVKY